MSAEFSRALKQAFTDLCTFDSIEARNLIPDGYGDLQFPHWFRTASWLRRRHPALSMARIGFRTIDTWYEPMDVLSDMNLNWDRKKAMPVIPAIYHVLWQWLNRQPRFATCRTVVSEHWSPIDPLKSTCGLMVCAHLHFTDLSKDRPTNANDSRSDFESVLAEKDPSTWIHEYPRLLRSSVRRALAFWPSPDA